jgi:Protein of unknown function (DUF2867)
MMSLLLPTTRDRGLQRMRVPREQCRRLSLAVHGLVRDVPLHDVTAVDLPGGGARRTIADVRALLARDNVRAAHPLVRGLFALRTLLGRLYGWDAARYTHPETSFIHRLSRDITRRSALPPGAPDGPFRILYVLEREALAEVRNATVHAFLASVLTETPCGSRLYWAVYVHPVSRLTPLSMALIEPFRRYIVYPASFRRIRRAWEERYPRPLDPRASGTF